MTDQLRCPLCAESHDDRTDLRVHLEVEHRKSKLVTELIDGHDTAVDSPLEDDSTATGGESPAVLEEEPAASSAD